MSNVGGRWMVLRKADLWLSTFVVADEAEPISYQTDP